VIFKKSYKNLLKNLLRWWRCCPWVHSPLLCRRSDIHCRCRIR